jgi:CRP-like cAMP-binding protein
MARTDEALGRVEFFEGLSARELKSIARLMTRLEVREGRTLVREGTVGREFFVIIDGEAEVTRNGRRINHLGPGETFGEIALLDTSPRVATVTALSDMTVEVLTRSEFADLLDDAPGLTRKLLRSLAAMLVDTDD